MRIGFDAYFAFHYKTGVAHYGRNLVNGLARLYPEVELILFTDEDTSLYQPSAPNVTVIETGHEIKYHEWLSSDELASAIQQQRPDIFHGLDHGLPQLNQIKSVVTIHDLFFESHPEFYSAADAGYYQRIAPRSCELADAIIAISHFTRSDIVGRYGIPTDKITVCYQSCNPLFFKQVGEETKMELRRAFSLPERFWLYVGSIIERKNLLNVCKAIYQNRNASAIPIVVIGEGSDYLETVMHYVNENLLNDRVRFLSYTDTAKNSITFQQAKDVPAFYQMATALIYPSYLEGFGIPLVEAFASGLPVITSPSSSLPEIGGEAALYVDPFNVNDIANALLQLEKDEELRRSMINKGRSIAMELTEEKSATSVVNLYRQLL